MTAPGPSPERRLLDDCFLTDRERMTHGEALALIRERIGRVTDAEVVPLGSAPGRILAAAIAAPRDVPAYDNAAVDGYAYASADYPSAGGWFPVSDRIAAGHPPRGRLAPGTAVRIFTGAAMPDGADTVAMQEDCEPHVQGPLGFVAVPPGLKPGANRRKAGEDLKAGAEILAPGAVLRPQDVAAIASTGATDVAVWRRLRVALASTGDEIVRPGTPLGPGQVYDSNQTMLAALLAGLGATVTDLGVLPDRAEAVEAALAGAAGRSDMVITTGGVSRGEEDHVVAALDRLGRRHLWQIAVKPGRPMSLGQIGDAVFVGLPGNPVAVMVCFLLYVRPMLLRLGGAAWREPARFQVPADFSVGRKKPDRREFLRGTLVERSDGTVAVRKYPRDGSGLITSLREADGLIELPDALTAVVPGDLVRFIPFGSFGL